jgi:hypothetical protein
MLASQPKMPPMTIQMMNNMSIPPLNE